MTVSWNLLTLVEARGFVRNYTVFYSPVSSGSKRQQTRAMFEVTVDGNTTIGGLNESLVYSVQVSANTGAGTGARSMAVILLVLGMCVFENS